VGSAHKQKNKAPNGWKPIKQDKNTFFHKSQIEMNQNS
jgi:hypothetical protein